MIQSAGSSAAQVVITRCIPILSIVNPCAFMYFREGTGPSGWRLSSEPVVARGLHSVVFVGLHVFSSTFFILIIDIYVVDNVLVSSSCRSFFFGILFIRVIPKISRFIALWVTLNAFSSFFVVVHVLHVYETITFQRKTFSTANF